MIFMIVLLVKIKHLIVYQNESLKSFYFLINHHPNPMKILARSQEMSVLHDFHVQHLQGLEGINDRRLPKLILLKYFLILIQNDTRKI